MQNLCKTFVDKSDIFIPTEHTNKIVKGKAEIVFEFGNIWVKKISQKYFSSIQHTLFKHGCTRPCIVLKNMFSQSAS